LVATDVAARGLGKYCIAAEELTYVALVTFDQFGSLLPFLGHDLCSVVTQF
jgi:hypothetical protein